MQRISLILSEDQVDELMDQMEVKPEANAENQDVAIEALGDRLREEYGINLRNGFIEYHRTWKPNGRWHDDGDENYLRCPFTIVFFGKSGPGRGNWKDLLEWWGLCDLVLVHRRGYNDVKGKLIESSNFADLAHVEKMVVFGRERPKLDESTDESESKVCSLWNAGGSLNLLGEIKESLEICAGTLKQLAVGGNSTAIMNKNFISLYQRRLNAQGYVIVVDDKLQELDRLEWIFRQAFEKEAIFQDMRGGYIQCLHSSKSEEATEHIRRLVSAYGQRGVPFLLFLDCYLADDLTINILPTVETLWFEHPELVMMVFSGVDGGFPSEVLEYCKREDIIHRRKPVDLADTLFFDQVSKMIKQSEKQMDVRSKINAARDCEPLEEIVDLIDSHNNSELIDSDEDCRLYVCSDKMKKVLKIIEEAANPKSPQPLFIYGETGTGKTPCAIYYLGVLTGFRWGSDRPFRKVPHLSSNFLAESYLFGDHSDHDGRHHNSDGILAEAQDGVVFFEELHRIPISAQIKLLGVTQDREFTPLGETERVPFNGVFIGATNIPPEKCIKHGLLLKDLYWRFASSYPIDIPPLNERREDIWAIIIGLSQQRYPGKLIKDVWTEPALWGLVARDWSGDVRELLNKVKVMLRNVTGRRIQVQDMADLFKDDGELLRQCMLLEKPFLKDSKIAEKPVESGRNDWIKGQIDRVQRALSEEEFIKVQKKLPQDCPVKQIDDFHEWVAAIVRWCGEKDNQERWGILRSHFSAPGVDGIRKGIPQLHRNEWLKGFEKHLKEVNFGPKGNLFDQSRWRKIKNLKMTGAMVWRVFVYQALLGFNHNLKKELDDM